MNYAPNHSQSHCEKSCSIQALEFPENILQLLSEMDQSLSHLTRVCRVSWGAVRSSTCFGLDSCVCVCMWERGVSFIFTWVSGMFLQWCDLEPVALSQNVLLNNGTVTLTSAVQSFISYPFVQMLVLFSYSNKFQPLMMSTDSCWIFWTGSGLWQLTLYNNKALNIILISYNSVHILWEAFPNHELKRVLVFCSTLVLHRS